MTDQDIRPVLGRMAGARPVVAAGAEVTPARALRTAFARAAESAGGLKATAVSVAEECVALDGVAAALSDGDLALELHDGEGRALGVAMLDRELRAAFVESQTMGRLSAVPAPDRPVSVADSALCAPVVDAFLTETALATMPTPLAGWADGIRTAGRMDGARGVVLRLTEDRYRLLRIEVDLGVTGRSARLCLALPAARGEAAPEPEGSDWTDRLHRSVLPAPTALTAVLHRMSLPISRLEDMVVGDVLPLEGVTVASIRLEGAGNTVVARARLGQVGGMKAVRLEEPPPPDMRDAAPPAGAPTRSSAPRAQAGQQEAVAHGDSVDGQVAVRTGPNDRVDAHRPGEDAPAATLEDAPGAMLDHAPAATLEDHGLSGRDGAGPAAAPPPQEAVAYPADPRAPREARELG